MEQFDELIWNQVFQFLDQTSIINVTLTSIKLLKLKICLTHFELDPTIKKNIFDIYSNIISIKLMNLYDHFSLWDIRQPFQDLLNTIFSDKKISQLKYLDCSYCDYKINVENMINLISLNSSFCKRITGIDKLLYLVYLNHSHNTPDGFQGCATYEMIDVSGLLNLTHLVCYGDSYIFNIDKLINLTILECDIRMCLENINKLTNLKLIVFYYNNTIGLDLNVYIEDFKIKYNQYISTHNIKIQYKPMWPV